MTSKTLPEPNFIDQITELLSDLTSVISSDLASDCVNSTEADFQSLITRVKGIDSQALEESRLTAEQCNVVLSWFVDKGDNRRIKCNRSKRIRRANIRHEKALGVIGKIKTLCEAQGA